MHYFDLNIPFTETPTTTTTPTLTQTRKATRLKQAVTLLTFGYTAVAYTTTIKSPLTESHYCKIPPFSLSSLLSLSPSLSSSVNLHRDLLGNDKNKNSRFKQYTRLTLAVETRTHVAALNDGNPILKSYDLVAVLPLNQETFDLACLSSHVDMISVDCGAKLPYRLKYPMVKAAIARGVFFEITYSSLMGELQVRRQFIANGRLLAAWTGGKNLVVSSGAPSNLELRGPNDVANLLWLLGLSDEHAKAAISKNCRSLVENALRKNHFFKEAIRVEVMPAGAQTDPKEPWIVDDDNWDPISSGEGDLRLEDMDKAFSKTANFALPTITKNLAALIGNVPDYLVEWNTDLKMTESDAASYAYDFMSSRGWDLPKVAPKPQEGLISSHRSSLDQQGNGAGNIEQVMRTDSARGVCLLDLDMPDSWDWKGKSSSLKSGETESQNLVANHDKDMVLSESARETTAGGIGADGGRVSELNEVAMNESRDLDLPCQKDDSTPLVSDVVNQTEVGFSKKEKMPSDDQSDLSLEHPLCQQEVKMLSAESILNTNSMTAEDSSVKRKSCDVTQEINSQGVEGLTKEQGQREACCAELITKKFDKSEGSIGGDTTMEVSIPSGEDTDDVEVAEARHSSSSIAEASNQMEDLAKASESVSHNKSGKKVRRLVPDQVPRFPFKRSLQAQFKKKGRATQSKTKRK